MLFLTLLFAAFAQEKVWVEDYGQLPPDYVYKEDLSDHEYDWLYEVIMPEALRLVSPDKAFKSFRVHLKDTYKIFPHPEEIQKKNLKITNHVSGSITYVGFFRKKYKYDVMISPEGHYTLHVKVHLKKPTEIDKIEFRKKMQQATEIWNTGRVETDFSYSFLFEIVDDPKKAHYSVNVKDETRGPYDTNWARNWTSAVIAHEVGHMLGLGDEYETLSGNMDCLPESLMCSSWRGSLMKHHYYYVLRRLLK
jgi:hypothetical protein